MLTENIKTNNYSKAEIIEGDYIAIGNRGQGSIQIIDIKTGKSVGNLGSESGSLGPEIVNKRYGHMKDLNDIRYISSTNQLLSASDDSSVLIWDLIKSN